MSEVGYSKESAVTPKLYMSEYVLNGLESYQAEWRDKKPGKRLIRFKLCY